MDKGKLLYLRYFVLIVLVVNISLQNQQSLDVLGIILLLLFIINSQLRLFGMGNRAKTFLASLILEAGLAFVLYQTYKGALAFYFIINIVDGAMFFQGRLGLILNIIIVGLALALGKDLSPDLLFFNLSILGIISLLSLYIKEESIRIERAEDVYYKLKLSEEGLIRANEDLEDYADSIKELSVLRERNRISREIHDSVGHSLSTIIIQLGAIEKISQENSQLASQMAGGLREFSKKSLEDIRLVLRQLKPRDFKKYEHIGKIEELIKEFTRFTGIQVSFRHTEEKWPLNQRQSATIYRIVQEFLSNSLRHGQATRVNIYLNYNEDEMILTLKDDGKGVDKLEKGLGLTNIWERVGELGGQIEYKTSRNKGFLLRLVLRPAKKLEF